MSLVLLRPHPKNAGEYSSLASVYRALAEADAEGAAVPQQRTAMSEEPEKITS